MICAALATGESHLTGALESEDTGVMLAALQTLGLAVEHDRQARSIRVVGGGGSLPNPRADLQRNWRAGATIVKPFLGMNAFKLGYSTGVVTESGGDYDMLLLSFSRLFR